ncbi:MAG: SAM-dependent methyltransferase [Vicinamibacteria bacterium]
MNANTPTPERIFETMNAHQRTEALRGAIELDLFTSIGEGNTTANALAQKLSVSERGVRILSDYLVVIGLLSKEDGNYSLAPDTALFLDRRSPAYMGSAARFLVSNELKGAFQDVAGAVRKGGTTLAGQGSVEANNPLWVEFARGMAPLVRPAAEFIAELAGDAKKVLDIAAGHGLFGIHVAMRSPSARIYPVDWPAVLEVARENAESAKVRGRLHPLPGSAFEVDFGEGYDVALLTNFFHHFDRPTCVQLMKKVHRALAPGGRAMTLEFVPNDDRVSPPQPAAFPFIMLNSTPSGDAYTFAEYQDMFREAGFVKNELHPPPGLPQSVIVSFK